ncbi:MAG: copper amine oxidase N-terminal domain-containing protein [Clostridia bacterium]|nr:copper amine oxidase N-terminal domain-containing protein [Clostridia bacterium]
MKNLVKTIIFLVLTFAMIFMFSTVAFANETPVTVFIDDVQIDFDVEPIIESGRTLVPMRRIFEALGAKVDWVDETKTAVAVKDDLKIEITIDSNQMFKNQEIVELDVPAKLIDGRTLVPARAVSEGLGCKVEWNGDLRRVDITTTDAETDREYTYKELSHADTEKLLSMKNEFRYTFEQMILPQNFYESSEVILTELKKKNPKVIQYVEALWDGFGIELVLQIQIDSETVYVFDEGEEITEELLLDSHTNILKQNGMDAENTFDVTYETTKDGNNVLLVTFRDANSKDALYSIQCKYIAIVLTDDGIRYITAETDAYAKEILGKECYMLCEVAESDRKSYGIIGTTKEDFLSALDELLAVK